MHKLVFAAGALLTATQLFAATDEMGGLRQAFEETKPIVDRKSVV